MKGVIRGPFRPDRGAPVVLLCGLFVWAAASAAFAAVPQASPDTDTPLQSWRVDYEAYGGFASVLQHVSVADDGKVMVTTGDIFREPVRFQANAAEMARVIAALRKLKLPAAPPVPLPAGALPDAPFRSLNVTYGGKHYAIGSTGADLLAALDLIQKRGLALAACAKGPQMGSTLEHWTIEYSYSGGLAGLSAHIAVTDDGTVIVGNRIYQPEQARFAATSDEMAKIVAALRELNLSGPPRAIPPARPMPDAIMESLSVTYGGQRYPIAPRGSALPAILGPMLTRGMNLARDAKWAKAGPFRAGRTWAVQLEVRDTRGAFHGEYWNAVWTRRGEGDTFDAVWRNTRTNEEVHDIVILDSAERGHVAVHRPSQNQRLEGSYRPESPDRISGNLVSQQVSGCPGCPGPYWQATVRYQ